MCINIHCTYTFENIHTCIYTKHTHLYRVIHIHTHLHTHILIYIYTYTHVYTRIYTYIYTFSRVTNIANIEHIFAIELNNCMQSFYMFLIEFNSSVYRTADLSYTLYTVHSSYINV